MLSVQSNRYPSLVSDLAKKSITTVKIQQWLAGRHLGRHHFTEKYRVVTRIDNLLSNTFHLSQTVFNQGCPARTGHPSNTLKAISGMNCKLVGDGLLVGA